MAAIIHLPLNNRGATAARALRGDYSIDNVSSPVCALIAQTFGVSLSGQSNTGFEKVGGLDTPVDTSIQECCANGLIATVHEAFANERPLRLAPEHIWTAVIQAVAAHVTTNAEALRHKFVAHQGKKEICVRHDGLQLGQPARSPWHQILPQFETALRDNVVDGSFVDAVVTPFSTSTQVSRAVFSIALMDSLKEYFSYTVMTMCGIPSIELAGTADDWRALRARAAALCEHANLQWWAAELLPVLDEFVAACSGDISTEFWQRIYQRTGPEGSGTVPGGSGWINVFFPYYVGKTGYAQRDSAGAVAQNMLREPAFWNGEKRYDHLCSSQINFEQYPSGATRVPFVWKYFDTDFDMTMCAGFVTGVGVFNSAAGVVQPALCWAVAHGKPAPLAQQQRWW